MEKIFTIIDHIVRPIREVEAIGFIRILMNQLNWNLDGFNATDEDIFKHFLVKSFQLLEDLAIEDAHWVRTQKDFSLLVQPTISVKLGSFLAILLTWSVVPYCTIRIPDRPRGEGFIKLIEMAPKFSDIFFLISIIYSLISSLQMSSNLLDAVLRVNFYDVLTVLFQLENELTIKLKSSNYSILGSVQCNTNKEEMDEDNLNCINKSSNCLRFQKFFESEKEVLDWIVSLNDSLVDWIPLNSLFRQVYSLLAVGKKNSVPWLVDKCSSLLTKILIHKSGVGVFSALQFFLDTQENDGNNDVLIKKVSQTIALVPRNMQALEYYKRIGTQLVKLLYFEDPEGNSEKYHRVVSMVFNLIGNRDPMAAVQTILQPLCVILQPWVELFKYNLQNSRVRIFQKLEKVKLFNSKSTNPSIDSVINKFNKNALYDDNNSVSLDQPNSNEKSNSSGEEFKLKLPVNSDTNNIQINKRKPIIEIVEIDTKIKPERAKNPFLEIPSFDSSDPVNVNSKTESLDDNPLNKLANYWLKFDLTTLSSQSMWCKKKTATCKLESEDQPKSIDLGEKPINKNAIRDLGVEKIFEFDQIVRFVKILSFLTSSVDTQKTFEVFIPIIPGLFELWKTLLVGLKEDSNMKPIADLYSAVSFLLDQILRRVDLRIEFEMFKFLCLSFNRCWNLLETEKGFSFQIKDKNISLVSFPQHVELLETDDDSLNNKLSLNTLLRLIDRQEEGLEAPNLAGNVFIFLLDQLSLVSNIELLLKMPQDTILSVLETELVYDEELHSVMENYESYQRLVLELIISISQDLGVAILRDGIQVCMFIKKNLQSGHRELSILSLTILEQIIDTNFLTSEESQILLIDILPAINNLCEHEEKLISKLAISVRNKIRSVPQNLNKNKESEMVDKKPVIFNRSSRKWVQTPLRNTIEECLEDISSPIPAIKAGGMIQLRRIILYEDREALERIDEWIKIFMKNLESEDSYVYQGAIWGLASIGDVNVLKILPILKSEFHNTNQSIEIRLNVGEALLQICRRLGDGLRKYCDQFLPIFLVGFRHDREPLVRASSLSNIAEICNLVKFSLVPYINEILDTLSQALDVEKNCHVRQALIYLLRLLFEGLDHDILLLITSRELETLRRKLILIKESDPDEPTRLHADYTLFQMEVALQNTIRKGVKQLSSNTLLEPLKDPYGSLKIVK